MDKADFIDLNFRIIYMDKLFAVYWNVLSEGVSFPS
jgi:hypothetical protein